MVVVLKLHPLNVVLVDVILVAVAGGLANEQSVTVLLDNTNEVNELNAHP